MCSLLGLRFEVQTIIWDHFHGKIEFTLSVWLRELHNMRFISPFGEFHSNEPIKLGYSLSLQKKKIQKRKYKVKGEKLGRFLLVYTKRRQSSIAFLERISLFLRFTQSSFFFFLRAFHPVENKIFAESCSCPGTLS